MKSSYQLMLLLSGAFLFGIVSGSSLSLQGTLAQGYEGLFAPQQGGGGENQPLGYRGVIPGYVPDQSTVDRSLQGDGQAKKKTVRKKSKYKSKYANKRKRKSRYNRDVGRKGKQSWPKTIEDIETEVGMNSKSVDWGNVTIPPALEKTFSTMMTPWNKEILSRPQFRREGMLGKEAVTKQKIDQIMNVVQNRKWTKEQRKIVIDKAEKKLRGMAYAHEASLGFSVNTLPKMNMPKLYIKEAAEDSGKSLVRVERALQQLRRIKYR